MKSDDEQLPRRDRPRHRHARERCSILALDMDDGHRPGERGERVVSVGSMAGFPGTTLGKPTMFALDARTGRQLWSFVSGGSVSSSPAIVDGRLFWGSGFANYFLGDPNTKLFSFSR